MKKMARLTSVMFSVTVMVVVHTSDVLWRTKPLLESKQSQPSLNTSYIVNFYNPIQQWSITIMVVNRQIIMSF